VPTPSSPPAVWLSDTDFDPLHIPSLFVFSLSLFGPLSGRMARSVEDVFGNMQPRGVHVGLALVGGFVVGVGLGLLMRSR
jgi:mannose/fructose/N-acetylgalactosamine-specific phosphotransferase system component IIC